MDMQELSVGAAGRATGSGDPVGTGRNTLESGLGAWASAISADDNAQAAIALAEAINRARNSHLTRDNRASDARVIAIGRLETLRARLAPIYAAIPRDVELFDLGVVGQTPPRLFVDIIAFIEMTPDGRGFRMMQETRSGRILLGETADEKQMTALVTNYIAERLVERERALAAQSAERRPAPLPKAVPDALIRPETAAPRDPAVATAAVVMPSMAMVEPARKAEPAAAVTPPQSAAPAATAQEPRQAVPAAAAPSRGGGWFWPLLALAIGIGLGALALYLYALSLNRV